MLMPLTDKLNNKPNLFDKGYCLTDKASLLAEQVCLPAAVLSKHALENNQKWMQSFADKQNVLLAPHGKTSMAPALYQFQIDSGCWAISLATSQQVFAAYLAGIRRIILANQLVGKANIQAIAQLVSKGDLTLYCFVDSISNAEQLNAEFAEHQCHLNVLVEIGVESGRCGTRSPQQATALAEKIKQLEHLKLAGIGFYEGVIRDDPEGKLIREFVDNTAQLALRWQQQDRFDTTSPIVTGAGSAWYDIVASGLDRLKNTDFKLVLRPGCYLIHDTGIYQQAQNQVNERSSVACDITGDLTSSLQVWAYVQSVPEPGLAVVGIGKRDVAFDAGLPTPELIVQCPSQQPSTVSADCKLVNIMDQHAMMSCPADMDIKAGDMVVFSTSHPCLTMDKWRYVGLIDEQYQVQGHIKTYF